MHSHFTIRELRTEAKRVDNLPTITAGRERVQKMMTILSKRDRRHLELLEMLMDEGAVTLQAASEHTGYPVRTLSSDIKQINAYLAPCQIVTGNEGLSLTIPQTSSVREVYALLLSQSREYSLLRYLFFNEGNSQEKIAEDQYISISTFRRMVQSINKSLVKKKLGIGAAPSFTLVGDETGGSHFMVSVFYELAVTDYDPMTPEESALLYRMVQRLQGEFGIHLNTSELRRVCLWAYVRLVRIKCGHYMTDYAKSEVRAVQSGLLDDIALQEEFYAVFGVQLDKTVLFEMYRMFLRKEFALSIDDIKTLSAKDPGLKKLDMQISFLLSRAARLLHISTKGTEILRLNLFNFYAYAGYPPYALYNRSFDFIKGFVAANQAIAQVLNEQVELAFQDEAREDVKRELLCYLIIHWPGLLRKIEEHMPQITVGFFFDSDVAHADMIASIVRRYSKANIVDIVPQESEDDSLPTLCQEVDLLVTNIPHLHCGDTTVICIHEYPTPQDWRNISMAQEQLYQRSVFRQSMARGV